MAPNLTYQQLLVIPKENARMFREVLQKCETVESNVEGMLHSPYLPHLSLSLFLFSGLLGNLQKERFRKQENLESTPAIHLVPEDRT